MTTPAQDYMRAVFKADVARDRRDYEVEDKWKAEADRVKTLPGFVAPTNAEWNDEFFRLREKGDLP